MKLLFLGTGAADFDIKHLDTSKNSRRNSSLLIDDKLLIDPGPCIFDFERDFHYHGLFDQLETVLNTHPHADHLNADSLNRLPVKTITPIPMLQATKAGEYIVTALPANHATSENPVHFILEKPSEGKTIFYGCDGAWLLYPAYREIIRHSFDLMIFDGTIGDAEGDYRIFEHNNIRMVEEMKMTLQPYARRFMISHLARTLHGTHEEAAARCARSGIEVAYDNLLIEI